MNQIAETLVELGTWTLRNSVQGGMLIVLIGGLYLALRRHVPTTFWVILWTVAGLRLLLPSSPESSVSLFNLVSTLLPSSNSDPGMPRQPVEIAGSTPTGVPSLESGPPADRSEFPLQLSPSLPLLLSSIWLLGAIGIPLFALAGYFAMARRIRRYPALDDPSLNQIFLKCALEAGIRHPPALVEGKEATGVAVFGGFRPTHLIVPRHFSSQYAPSEIRSVFLHEMGHVRRGDLFWNWVTLIMESIHWFNPPGLVGRAPIHGRARTPLRPFRPEESLG